MCLGLNSLKSIKQNKTPREFFILNDRQQCKDCPLEIGRLLNELDYIPKMAYIETNSPLINRQTEEYFKSEYAEKFDFSIKKINRFPAALKANQNFPVLMKVVDSDTTIFDYDQIFSGRKGKINKKEIRKFIER